MNTFSVLLLDWFYHSGRKNLPWQLALDPYPVWISEIMLQQTQVKTVIPYYTRFMLRFPTIFDLAKAPQDEVLTHWAGLGYYARARNLLKMAQIIVSEYQGHFPEDLDTLKSLPGLGRSTASAILAICHGKMLPILDGNVKRVLTRYLGISGYPGDKKIETLLWQQAENLLPQTEIPAYTQAIMDLGALICTPKNPSCLLCPVQKDCLACQNGLTHQLPTPKPKKAYPTKKAYFLIFTDGERVTIEKRPDQGIWGGMWCLPERDSLDSLQDKEFKIGQEYTHLFTHYRLLYTPIVIKVESEMLPTGIRFADLPNYALPAPIKTLLTEFGLNR